MSRTFRRKTLYRNKESFVRHAHYSFPTFNITREEYEKDLTYQFRFFHSDQDTFCIWKGAMTQDCKNRREIERLKGIRSREKQEVNKVLKDIEYEPDFSQIVLIKKQTSWWW